MLGQLENYFIEAYSRTCHSASVETPIAAMIKREVEGARRFYLFRQRERKANSHQRDERDFPN
jgi:hypothetical protein